MPRFMVGVYPSAEPEGCAVTRSRIDIFSVNVNGGASRKTEPLGVCLGRHDNRFNGDVDLEEVD